jgi:phosphatidate phosphatase APP1
MPGPPVEAPETRTLRRSQRLWARLKRWSARIELLFDRAFWGFRARFGRLGPLQVVPYRGYGTRQQATLRGRVLEASVLERSLPADTRWRSIRRMLRRFNSHEVPDANVSAQWGQSEVSGQTDDEGYFELQVSSDELAAPGAWKLGYVEVTGARVRGAQAVRSAAEVLVPGPEVELCVVSDIDDTVLQTHVTQRLKMIWVTLSGSAFTRMPFEGTTELYRALWEGASGHADNPVFYVSKSPWNLYDFLVDFLDYHQLPRGPLLLRDIGLREAPPLDHKTEAVRGLLEMYAELPFVLIGDSGERDADIYVATAERYPGRVRAIYIRDLGGRTLGGASQRAAELRQRAQAAGTALLWVEHARLALEHARAQGWAR